MNFDDLEQTIKAAGFIYLGGFLLAERETSASQTLMLIGNAGPQMWERFTTSRGASSLTMDEWTRQTVSHLADTLKANALFPFDSPHHPFLSWAEKTGETFTSPIGLSIHPRYSLWHGYRAALIFDCALDLPSASTEKSPCITCIDKPCLTTCPVDAFSPEGYDVPACITHIKTTDNPDCLELGCRARRACPIGQDFHYLPQQARFHMSAFIKT